MKRIPSRELLDGDAVSAVDRAECLDDIWRINQRWGGVSGGLMLFDRFFSKLGPHPVRVLDVGAGDGRLDAFLAQRLRERNIDAKFFALDRQLAHLEANGHAANGLSRVVADVLCAPFPADSFNIVACNLFLHHFSGAAAIGMLRSMAAVATEAVFINDLDRRWLSYLLIRFAPSMARNRISRLDGAASVRQAYTLHELAALATAARSGEFETFKLPGFRNGLILWRGGNPYRRPAKTGA